MSTKRWQTDCYKIAIKKNINNKKKRAIDIHNGENESQKDYLG